MINERWWQKAKHARWPRYENANSRALGQGFKLSQVGRNIFSSSFYDNRTMFMNSHGAQVPLAAFPAMLVAGEQFDSERNGRRLRHSTPPVCSCCGEFFTGPHLIPHPNQSVLPRSDFPRHEFQNGAKNETETGLGPLLASGTFEIHG